MKIESTAFTAAELLGFLGDLEERDREDVARRLEEVGRRLEALRPRIEGADAPGGDGWTAQEVLAHISVLSKFYGVMAHQIATGKVTEFDFLGQVQLRDVAGERAAAEPASSLLDGIAADHARTLAFLRGVNTADLRKTAETGVEGLRISAADVVRLPLLTHLEAHLEQLEAAIR